jgi:hypothetical protein
MILGNFHPLPGEHPYSWLSRQYYLTGYPSPNSFLKHLGISCMDLMAQAVFENGITKIFRDPQKPLLSTEFLWSNTAYPLWLLSEPDISLQNTISGIEASKLNEHQHMNERLLLAFSQSWHACPTCIIHDVKNYGIPYWHNKHQLPSVVTCYKHHQILVKPKGNVKNLKDLILPNIIKSWEPVIEKPNTVIIKWSEACIKLFEALIRDRQLAYTLRSKIDQLTYVNSHYRIQKIKWCTQNTHLFEKALGPSLLHHLFKGYSIYSDRRKPQILASVLASNHKENIVRNPVYWIAIAYWLRDKLPEIRAVFDHDSNCQLSTT